MGVMASTNVRTNERPSSSFLKEVEKHKANSRPESPSRKSICQSGVSGKRLSDSRRWTGVQPDQKALAFQAIHQNLGEFNLLKEKIDVLKKKYN